jgi:hypothetical protein
MTAFDLLEFFGFVTINPRENFSECLLFLA